MGDAGKPSAIGSKEEEESTSSLFHCYQACKAFHYIVVVIIIEDTKGESLLSIKIQALSYWE